MDISQAFEATGADVTTTNTLKHALIFVEHLTPISQPDLGRKQARQLGEQHEELSRE